jgi:hypothetical protein
MSETAATYTYDECGYQAAGLAPVVEHLRSGARERIIDLVAWLREALGDQ